jgi:23S rRNA (guanosine2251-2'-O)-methyltransferase
LEIKPIRQKKCRRLIMKKDKASQATIIYGRHPVMDALKGGEPIDKIVLQQGVRGDFERELRRATKIANIPLQVIPKERLNYLVKGNHQGVAAWMSMLRYYRLEDVLPGIYEKGEMPLLLLLDGVTDVRNFGAIARSAELLGVHAIIIAKKGSAQINAEAIKTSAGALTNIAVCRESSLINAIEQLQTNGIQVMASSLQASDMLYDLDLTQPVAFVMGSEGKGISPPVLRACDRDFIIPQLGTTDSFNVSVATGVILYEATRQRIKTEGLPKR